MTNIEKIYNENKPLARAIDWSVDYNMPVYKTIDDITKKCINRRNI